MNCPDCGRFMYIWPTTELEPDASMEDAAFHWLCPNAWDCLYAEGRRGYIPAPEYDWVWWGISEAEVEGGEHRGRGGGDLTNGACNQG